MHTGFNCAEACNIATPKWLRYAREAAIRRTGVNYPPLVSHIQLLYDIALSVSSRVPVSIEPKSSRLKEKKKGEGECLVKELFVQDVMRNTNLLHSLGKGSPAILSPRYFIEGNFPNLRDGLFSCVACGDLCFACAAIIKPSEVDVHNLMSDYCGNIGGNGVAVNNCWTHSTGDTNNGALDSGLGRMAASCITPPKDTSSLALLALTYGDATDSETDPREVSSVGLDEDSSRSHVFYLQHAFEVKQKLHALGGVDMLLLCHPGISKASTIINLSEDIFAGIPLCGRGFQCISSNHGPVYQKDCAWYCRCNVSMLSI